MSLDLSVIITTYNSSDTLRSTLDSISRLDTGESPLETIVVDNDSRDDSVGIARSFPFVKLITSESNLGLAAANNIGAGESAGSSLLFLNPDAEILPGALKTMDQFRLEHPDAALIGPAMVDADGEYVSSARTWPSILDIALRRTFLGKLPGTAARLGAHLFPVGFQKPSTVDWITGAAMWLTPAGRDQVGLMSERYFLYFEDVQWCMRAWRSGMRVWFVPGAVIRHAPRRESAGSTGRALWLHLRSMIRFFGEYPCAAVGRCVNEKFVSGSEPLD